MSSENKKTVLEQSSESAASSSSQKEQLNEFSLSWAGKLFFAGVASYLAGVGLQKAAAGAPKLPFKIRGTPEQIKAITDAILASKAFQEEIKKPGATVESVIQKLNLRNMNKDRFKQLTGRPWPL